MELGRHRGGEETLLHPEGEEAFSLEEAALIIEAVAVIGVEAGTAADRAAVGDAATQGRK